MPDHEIADLMLFEMSPQILHGIEFRCIGRQADYLQASVGGDHKLFDRLAAMNGGSVPQDQQRAWQVTQERFQEVNDLGTFDRSSVDLKIEVPESDAGNHREAFPTESLLDDWGLAAGRPSAHPVRARTQAAFVEEDDGASFARGFFLR